MPKINFGLNARFEYKRFTLSIATCFGALNYHVSDDIYNSLNSCYGWGNKEVGMLDANRFSEDGSTYLSNVPRTYVTNSASLGWNDLFSSRKIQNAAYWKIANVELGYNFPDKWFDKYVSDVTFLTYRHRISTHLLAIMVTMWIMQEELSLRDTISVRILLHVIFMCGVHFTF